MRRTLFFAVILFSFAMPVHADMYKWVDEKGTVHFTDDASKIPEQYRKDVEERKAPKEVSSPGMEEKPVASPVIKTPEPEGFEVNLLRKHELWKAEVFLNERVRRHLIVDSGASFILINHQTAKELGLVINETTPFLPGSTVSGIILTPMMTLESVRVGNARVKNIEAVIHNMPSGEDGLLGNSFLNKFKVVIDSINGKLTLFPLQGVPSADRPGGYGKDYWAGHFRFYNRNLAELKKLKARYEGQGMGSESNRVNNAIRYFENRLSELEREASFAGVPRNWRD